MTHAEKVALLRDEIAAFEQRVTQAQCDLAWLRARLDSKLNALHQLQRQKTDYGEAVA